MALIENNIEEENEICLEQSDGLINSVFWGRNRLKLEFLKANAIKTKD
jgi:hypothetical protein